MPTRPLGPCKVRTCRGRATERGYCATHAREHPAPRQPDTRPSSTQRGYDVKWRRIRAMFLRKYPSCVRCGAEATDVDHIISLAKGGTNEWVNLQSYCHSCHSIKTNPIMA